MNDEEIINNIIASLQKCPYCNKLPGKRKGGGRKKFCNINCKVNYMKKHGKKGYGIDI
jgi:hypothetical protein